MLPGLWSQQGLAWVTKHRNSPKVASQTADIQLAPVTAAEKKISPEQLQLLEQSFSQFDVDGDNCLSLNELKQMLEALGLKTAKKDMKVIMQELDYRSTGKVNRQCPPLQQ